MSENNINYPAHLSNEVPAIADIELPASTATGVPVEQRNFIQHGDGTQIGEVDGDVNITNTINVTDEQLKRVLADVFKGSIPVSVPDNSGAPSNTSVASASAPLVQNEHPAVNTSSAEGHTHTRYTSGSTTSASLTPTFISHAIEWNSLSTERYCLFVLENEEYNMGSFSISKNCSLRYTDKDIYEKIRFLDADALQELKSMPCIFAKRNNTYGTTNSNHPAVIGRLVEIANQGQTIKFTFNGFQAIPQQVLNENVVQLNLARASLRNELDEEHWSIKSANLINILHTFGIIVR